MRTQSKERSWDSFETHQTDESRLLEEVEIQDNNTEWVEGLNAKDFHLTEIDSPIFAGDIAEQYGLDEDALIDICEEGGTQLIAHNLEHSWPVASTAISTLGETAKLYGAALGRMLPADRATVYSCGLAVARGKSILPIRYGRVAAFHSDGYLPMKSSTLLDETRNTIVNKFGEPLFLEGTVRHDFVRAMWELPEVTEELMRKYKKSLNGVETIYDLDKMVPSLRFSTSDTATSAATLQPEFRMHQGSNAFVRLTNGISVRHERKGSDTLQGIDLYKVLIEEVYSKFDESIEAISALSKIPVFNGANCVVSLCKRYNISRRYGDVARQEIEDFQAAGMHITAHDIYLSLSNAIGDARYVGVTAKVIETLEENVARILKAKWEDHDVGGVVAWD